MIKYLLTASILIACLTMSLSQNTVGLLTFDEDKTTPGYNLHYPNNQGNAYLLDNCGQIVHMWEEDNFAPGNGIILDENGDLYMCKGRGRTSNPNFHAGGGGEKLEVRDWDNNLLWEFTINNDTMRMHHDITLNPNTDGVFIIVWEVIDIDDAIAAGRDPSLLNGQTLWPDKIVEVEPDGNGGGTIVWEWRAWDHLIQDFDSTKENFGDPSANPGKIDVNIGPAQSDWMHGNSLDYNASLDQLLLSVPEFDEFWIIDHNLTTEEAAGPEGDLLFRWGSPINYRAGTEDDQQLFFQHDAHWLRVAEDHPDFGKIGVFNNQVGTDFSSVHILSPEFDASTGTYPMEQGRFLPEDFEWSYIRPIPQDLFSTGLSSIQRLSNGNTLITSGRMGYAFEITPEEEIVWEYVSPLRGGAPVTQGTELTVNQNILFRFNRYETDYPAFVGRDLEPSGFLELDPNPLENCAVSSTSNLLAEGLVNIYPNPTNDYIQIEFDSALIGSELKMMSLTGETIQKINIRDKTYVKVDANGMDNGIYFINIDGVFAGRIVVAN